MAAARTIAANNTNFRIFEIMGPGGNLSLNHVTLTGGKSTFLGGAILNLEGTLSLNGVVVTGNSALAAGGITTGTGNVGPIGKTDINNSQIVDNTGATGGETDHPNGGGGIVNRGGTLTINNSVISGNTAFAGGGIATGPGDPENGGSLTKLNNVKVDDNTVYRRLRGRWRWDRQRRHAGS